jgi:hypothetical protein
MVMPGEDWKNVPVDKAATSSVSAATASTSSTPPSSAPKAEEAHAQTLIKLVFLLMKYLPLYRQKLA